MKNANNFEYAFHYIALINFYGSCYKTVINFLWRFPLQRISENSQIK